MGYPVEDQHDVECRLRDGVLLRADVYRPAAPGRFPVLLCRTPYDKRHPRYVRIAAVLAERGYVAVVQDIRGRNASGGDWVWHMTEEGQALGLSHYLVEPGEGLAKGIELAKRIATNSPTTNFAVINVLPRIAEQDRASGYVMESLTAAIAQGSDEAKKRIRDFLEKRGAKVVRK